MRTKSSLCAVLGGLLLAGLQAPRAQAAPVELRVATLAPAGSPWAKILQKGAKEIESKTGGRVKLLYFFSGQQGDEQDVVRKMKLGQLDGAGVSGVGLGLIKSDVRVVDLPFLFKSDKEVDHVRAKLAPDFEQQFDAAGYVLLGWADVGWVHIFSNIAINTKADLLKTKMWAWKDDPIVRALMKRIGVNGVALGVPEVMAGLQTGSIDACYGTPYLMVGLQWYTKVKFGTAVPITYSSGALVVRKDSMAKISPEDQKVVREVARAMAADMVKSIRSDNERARKVLLKGGIQFVNPQAAALADLTKEAQGSWDELAGKVYNKDLLAKVKAAIAEVRK